MKSLNEVRTLLTTIRTDFLGRANVVATGIGYKETAGKKTSELCIVCSVAEKLTAFGLAASDRIPSEINGVPIDVKRTGTIRASLSHRARMRPAQGGVSIGHVKVTAGTLGCLVKRNKHIFILSNNHVLANSNEARVGDAILQPGVADGGSESQDQLATLYEFIPIHYLHETISSYQVALGKSSSLKASGSHAVCFTSDPEPTSDDENLIDAALAKPAIVSSVSDQIVGIGHIAGLAEGKLGMTVLKSGRTTGVSEGEIEQIDVTANVEYGGGHIARFHDQLMAGPMSEGGDSGSAVLDNNRRMVGLLFAGSESTTLINRVQHVFRELNVTLLER